ncbi:hypothetical protein WJU16_25050 [Chitinophaga pollutisoli]|uniref:Uncharacterized protein n=1 Tax=Chitinophaga pollutisoli TaxID=3133966 RepID=A0ABZ2YNC7_9BACT
MQNIQPPAAGETECREAERFCSEAENEGFPGFARGAEIGNFDRPATEPPAQGFNLLH